MSVASVGSVKAFTVEMPFTRIVIESAGERMSVNPLKEFTR